MANVSVTYTLSNGQTSDATLWNTNYSDIVTWLNNRNAATTAWDGFKSDAAITITPTSNQIVLGVTNTTTLSATAPSVSRTYTIPDGGANGAFVLSVGASTISGTKTFTSAILGGDGTATDPEYAFSADTNTGMYRITGDQIGWTAGGTRSLALDATELTFSSGVRIGADVGSAGSPSISFTADTNTGIYRSSADTIAFSTGGSARAAIGTTDFTINIPIFGSDGLVGTPFYTFDSDRNTGVWRVTADTVGISGGGVQGIQVDNSSTATHTRLLVFDVDNNTVERVTVGVADSGGAGFKLLRIPN